MSVFYFVSRLVFPLFLCVAASSLWAQTGSISGKVLDADGRAGLPGASVYLKDDLATGTVTDLNGAFLLGSVPAGTQTLIVTYVGFADKVLTVQVEAGKTVKVEALLSPEAIVGEEVVVTAQALGQAKAINQQLNADAIANFVSADKIKELPDVNAAEAISRLPGVAINRSGGEGSKIVVRGLDPKFTAISINGVRLPSTSPNDRSVDLSLISPELLSGIELFKSPTPDMDGDALGGSVNLNILKAPKERKISIKGLNGYNAIAQAFRDYKGTVSLSQRVFDDKLGIIATANIERFYRGGETISQSWGDNTAVVLDTLLDVFEQLGNSLQYAKRSEVRRRYNGSVGLDFNLGEKNEFTLLGIYSRTSRDQYNQVEQYNANGNSLQFTPQIIESSIDLYSASLAARHNLRFLQVEWGAAYSKIIGKTPYNFEMQFRNTSNAFDPEVLKFRKSPDRFFDFVKYDESVTHLQGAGWVDSDNSEQNTSAFVHFSKPFKVGSKTSVTFKFGGKYLENQKSRNYFERYAKNYYLRKNEYFKAFKPDGVGALGADPSGVYYYSVRNFTNGDIVPFTRGNGQSANLFLSFAEADLRRFRDVFINDIPHDRFGDVNNYDLTETVLAGYSMLKININNVLTLIPGFRYEYSDNVYNGLYADLNGDWGESGAIKEVSTPVTYGIFLPHLHVKLKPLDWFDIRASYSTTLARPDYDYVVPATLVNRNGDLTVNQGNPNLKASVSTNYDLYATAFSGDFGLLSVGVFYKDIQDAFYPFVAGLNNDSLVAAYGFPSKGFGGAELTTYRSSPESYVKGFEFDLQSNMNFLPKPFNDLVLNVNYSRLFSETTVNSFYEQSRLAGVFPFFYTIVEIFPFQRNVDLIGQAEHIFNASLGYDLKSTSVRVSTAYQGTKLSGYSSSSDKDRYNAGFWRMDAAVKQKFGKGWNAFLNLNNLTNQKDINFFRSKELVTSIQTYGMTATFGFEYILR